MNRLKSSITILALACSTAVSAQTDGRELAPEAFQSAIAEGKAVLVDVRTPAEYASGHIAGSVNIDWSAKDYEAGFSQLDPNKPVLLYCLGGGRSEQAMEYLEGKGYSAAHLQGGISAWKKAGLPTER